MAAYSGSGVGVGQTSAPHKWFFSKEEMKQTASIRDGMSAAQELTCRQQAARFIQEMVDQLNSNVDSRSRINQSCMCAANMHMHRFFYFHSFNSFDYRNIGAACLFLSGKSEEAPRKLSHIVACWWSKKFPKRPTPTPAQQVEAAQFIVQLENIILQTISFDLNIDLPHPVVLNSMPYPPTALATEKKKITEVVYYFATDVLCVTNWGIRYSAAAIACVCIHIVFIFAQIKIPNDNNVPWYTKVDPNMTEELLTEITNDFLDIYYSVKDQLALRKLRVSTPEHLNIPRVIMPPPPPIMDEKPVLPPPPVPPTIAKKVDLAEYKERNRAAAPSGSADKIDRNAAVPPRKSFFPDMSQVTANSHSSREPSSVQPHSNGRREEKDRDRQREKEKERERRKHHEKERRHHERPEDREKRKEEERRKREADAMNNSSSSLYPPEKKSRPDLSSSFVSSASHSLPVTHHPKPQHHNSNRPSGGGHQHQQGTTDVAAPPTSGQPNGWSGNGGSVKESNKDNRERGDNSIADGYKARSLTSSIHRVPRPISPPNPPGTGRLDPPKALSPPPPPPAFGSSFPPPPPLPHPHYVPPPPPVPMNISPDDYEDGEVD